MRKRIRITGQLCQGNIDLINYSYNVEIRKREFDELKEIITQELQERNRNFQGEEYNQIEHLPRNCSALIINNKKKDYQMNAEIFLLRETIPERDVNRTHCGIAINKQGRIQLGLPEYIGSRNDPARFGHYIKIQLNSSCY